MIFAELFYPKELKETIADLRAKDDLNEEALKTLTQQPLVFSILYMIFIAMIYISAPVNFITFTFISLGSWALTIFLIWGSIRSTFRQMKVYMHGIRGEAITLFVYNDIKAPGTRVKIKSRETLDYIILGPFLQWSDKSQCPQIEEKIHYYSLGSKSCENMPDREEIKRQYCLSKSMLKGAE